MTTVLPEPVAILKARRGRPSLRRAFSAADDVERLGVADLLGGLGQVDRGLGGLELAEEEAALAVLGAPVREQVAAWSGWCAGSPGGASARPPGGSR